MARRIDLDTPLPILERIRLSTVPVVTIDGVDYYFDEAEQCFRDRQRPRICCAFDELSGRALFHALRMAAQEAGEV